MAFAAGDWIRVVKGLQLAIADKTRVQNALIQAESDEGLELAVKATLTSLETVVTALGTERSSASSALVKADVLEWEAGKRSSGLLAQQADLQLELANLLGLVWTKNSQASLTVSTVMGVEW